MHVRISVVVKHDGGFGTQELCLQQSPDCPSLPLCLGRCQTHATRTRMSPELLEVLWTASVRIPSSTIGQCANAQNSPIVDSLTLFERQVSVGVWRILARGGAAIYRGGFARRCRSRGCSAMRTSSQVHALSSGTHSHSDATLPLYYISTNSSLTTAK